MCSILITTPGHSILYVIYKETILSVITSKRQREYLSNLQIKPCDSILKINNVNYVDILILLGKLAYAIVGLVEYYKSGISMQSHDVLIIGAGLAVCAPH